MTENSANQWYLSFLANRPVEIKRKIQHNLKSEGYALRIGKLYSKELKPGASYRISAFFYDRQTSQMFGRPCHTNWIEVSENQQQECEFYEELFFHAPILDEKILLIFEFVENGGNEKSIGWTKRPIQIQNEAIFELLELPAEISTNLKTLEIYAGTPKCLIFGQDEVRLNPVGHVELQLFSHRPILEVSNYFPEFCLVGVMDDIPGILATENDPFLHHPQIDPQISASIDEVTVTFGPNAQKIEKMIIDEVLHDWNLKENAQFLAENLKISERRLKIGVHNGFSYLSEPISINLNASNSNILTNTSSLKKRRALSSNDLRNGPVSLFVNSRISIPNICEDPRVALIFLVEYTFAYEDRRKFSQQPILIGWGAWKPFGEEAAGSRHNVLASVSLVGGPRPNPEGALCFRNLLHLRQSDDSVFTESQPQITINFAFFLDQLRAESRITSLGDGPISARKSPKPKPKKLEPEPEETKILSSTKLPEISARSVNSELEILEISKDLEAFLEPLKQPEVGPESPVIYRIPEEKPQNFSRILHGLYTRLEFLRILDRNSEQPEIQDVNLKILSNFTVEKLDRLDIQHIFFQFCAMKKFEFAAEDTTVTRVFFSINFYRFPEMITESMILKQFEKSEPAALLRHDGKPGLVSKYIMDSDEDRVEFLEFLNSSHATIHIWDSDSLLLIGTCHVPLNNLMRRGKEAVQLFVQLPIFGIEPTNSRPVGMLAMKLANVGWPTTGGTRQDLATSSSGTVVRRLVTSQMLSEEGPHTYRVVAKPLRSGSGSGSGNAGLERFMQAQRIDLQQRHEQIFNEHALDKLAKWEKLKSNFSGPPGPGPGQANNKKFIFEEELAAYKRLRFESKNSKLLEAVFKGITVRHVARATFGAKIFFEFPLENATSEPMNVTVEMDDVALAICDDVDFLGAPRIFLKPGETLMVPFIYDTFRMQSDAENPKIVFRNRTAENFEPIAILDLHVHRKPPIFHENLVMYAEEARNCTRRVSASSNFAAGRIAAVRCSDPAVKLSIAAKNSIEFTAFCNDTPQKREFLIFAYTDCWQMKLAQVWRVTVVAMRRIDLRTVAGQMTKYRLSVKRRSENENVDDLLRVYCSMGSAILQESTILADRQPVVEMQFVLNFIGHKNLHISVVNTNSGSLEALYLLCTTSEAPRITQRFQVEVRIAEEEKIVKKTLKIRNPYGIAKKFQISTSCADILRISQDLMEIPAESYRNLEIFFQKITHKPANFETLLFISNQENNIQEEAFAILVKFV